VAWLQLIEGPRPPNLEDGRTSNRCRLKKKGYAWIRKDDGGADLFAHFREFDGNEEWANFGVVEGSISTLFLDAITFAFNCSCYKKAFILI